MARRPDYGVEQRQKEIDRRRKHEGTAGKQRQEKEATAPPAATRIRGGT